MPRFMILFSCCILLTFSAFLPHPHRNYHYIRHDYKFERNCFFSPAQCLLGNFPRSSKLQPVLGVFEDSSLAKIYAKLRPAFLDSRK